jgi:hypothetical protein
VKRTQGAQRPRDPAPKESLWGPSLLVDRRRDRRIERSDTEALPGSKSGAYVQGLSRNLGDLRVSSAARYARWCSAYPDQAGRRPRRLEGNRPERTNTRGGGTSGRGNEPAGRDTEESERSIVPAKPGNPPQGTRWREGKTREGALGTQNRRRERWPVTGRRGTSPRNKRG